MTAHIIDGKALAATVVADLGRRVATLKESGGPTPGLALIQVGDDAASGGYLRSKRKRAEAIGLLVQDHHVPAETDARTLRALITRLNEDPAIHGILLQLPIPDSLDADALLEAIKPAKDIDGLHPENLGRLAGGGDGLVACTPLGCLRLVQVVRPDLRGLKAVVLGRSRLVGAPIAQLLLRAGASVTVLHSQSTDEAAFCRQADILVSAVGKAGLVRGDWIKPGATVIDVANNDTENGLVGDVVYSEAISVAGAITPVPGGVGPMTIAMLLSNVVEACCRQHNLPFEKLSADGRR